jgi:UDP-glucose 4-epimerase
MKIIVFGGGGFLGSSIVDRLLSNSHEVRVFERPRIEPYRKFNSSERIEWIYGDILSVHDINKAIEGVDVVLHLVSTTLPKNSNDDPIFDVQSNLVGSIQILDAMVKQNVKKIVFISSGGTVYGNPYYLPIDEKHPNEPMVSYGVTKLAIEKYLLLYQNLHGIKANILRVTNPYGERQRVETAQGAVGVFMNRAIQKLPIEIWGDGNIVRDYLYVSDVAEAFLKAVEYSGEHSIFNISSNIGTSLNDLIKVIEKQVGYKLEINYKEGRAFDIKTSVLDNTLARNELNWQPKVSFEEGLKKTHEWFTEVLSNT